MGELQAVSITIAAVGMVVALITYATNRIDKSKDKQGTDAAQDAVVITKLDFIANDLKDIKAEQRSTRKEIQDVKATAEQGKTLATHALERAEAAHNRIDRSGIDSTKGAKE